jgi:hypothetical protein
VARNLRRLAALVVSDDDACDTFLAVSARIAFVSRSSVSTSRRPPARTNKSTTPKKAEARKPVVSCGFAGL